MPAPTTQKDLVLRTAQNSFDWVDGRFFDHQYLTGPNGRKLAMGARRDGLAYPQNHPDFYYSKGLHALHVNHGYGNTPFAPIEKRAVFSGRDFFKNATGNKQFNHYNTNLSDPDNDVRKCINSYFSHGGGIVNTYDTMEVYDGTGWYYSDGSMPSNADAYVKLWKAMGQEAEARGQVCGMDYGSSTVSKEGLHFQPGELTGSELQNALSSNQALLTYLTSRGDPYHTQQLYNFGCSRIVNTYRRGLNNPHLRLFEHFVQRAFGYGPRAAAGHNKSLIAFTQGYTNEFTQADAISKKTIPAGGEFISAHTPPVQPDDMLFIATTNALWYEWSFDFTAPGMFGTSLDVLYRGFTENGGQAQRFDPKGSGNNPKLTLDRGFYDQVPGNNGRAEFGGPYLAQPAGSNDYTPAGFNCAGFLERHVGSTNTRYVKMTMNGNTYTPGSGHSFCATMYNNDLPWALGERNGQTGNGYFLYDYRAGIDPVTVTFDLDGYAITRTIPPGHMNVIIFTSPGN